MKVEYLYKMDRIAKKARTREPEDVLAYMGYIFMDPGTSVDGFIMRRKGTTYYGVNQNISGLKYDFCVMHEGFHGLCRHYEVPGFLSSGGAHADTGICGNYKIVVETERDANIGAADFILDTQMTLDMLGYDCADVAAYRSDLESFEHHAAEYQRHLDLVRSMDSSKARLRRMLAYQQELARMYEELQEQARDIANSGLCLTKNEIAREFGVPEYIVDYKFEALELRNFDIPNIELPSFTTVFSNWN